MQNWQDLTQRIKTKYPGVFYCETLRDGGAGVERVYYTKGFARFVPALARLMSLQDVARLLGVGWDMVKDIYKRWLKRRFGQPKLKNVKEIAIDEISVRKGHKYVTLVLNLKTGAVVLVVEVKGADAPKPFWERLRRSGARIEAVAMDMGPAYIAAVLENLPGAPIVFDTFHVVKRVYEKLTEIRRRLHRSLEDSLQEEVLKGAS